MPPTDTVIRKRGANTRLERGGSIKFGTLPSREFSESFATAGFFVSSTCSALSINLVEYVAQWPDSIKTGFFIASTAGGTYLSGKHGYLIACALIVAAGLAIESGILWTP